MRQDSSTPSNRPKKSGLKPPTRRKRPGDLPERMHHPEVEDEVKRMQEAADTPPGGPLEG